MTFEVRGASLWREIVSREVSLSVGAVQTPRVKDIASREVTLSTLGDTPDQPHPELLSRESTFLLSTAAIPARIEEVIVTTSPTGDTVNLDWSAYNELLQHDVIRYDIYLSSQAFTDVTGMTPYASVPAETQSLTIGGLTAWHDYAFAVVAVDVLGQFDPLVDYCASHPLGREICSREIGLLVAAGSATGSGQTLSRESTFVVGTEAPPAMVTELVLDPSPAGDSVDLDWSAYNEILQRDIAHYDIYVSDDPFTDVSGMTPHITVPAGTRTVTIDGLTPWRKHCFAVVAVDVLGHALTTVKYTAAYALSAQVISREVSLHVGGREEPPTPRLCSREVSLLVPDAAVPDPVTGVGLPFNVTTSRNAYGAVDVDWTGYNEVAQHDIVRYRIYIGPSYFDDVSAMTPYVFTPAGILRQTVTGLTGDSINYVAVVAEDALGNWNPVVRAMSGKASISALGEVGDLQVESFADSLHVSWTAPRDNDTFLDHYRVYVGDNPAPISVPGDTTECDVDDLEAAHGYTIRVATVDWIDTESSGVSMLGATWLPHPTISSIHGFDGTLRLKWSPVEPAYLLKHYAIYVEEDPFSSVADKTPVLITTGTQIDVTGLTNGTAYVCAVTAVNISGGEDPTVDTRTGTPEPVPPVPYADLALGAISLPGQAYSGEEITIDWGVSNAGPGTTGNGEPDGTVDQWSDRLVLSRDTVLGNIDDIHLADVPHESSLAPAAEYAGTWTGPLPAGVTGVFYLFVRVDADDAVAEIPDNNSNVARADTTLTIDPPPVADLVTLDVTPALTAATFGDTMSVTWTVRNDGDLAVPMSWTDAVWLSRDTVFSPSTDIHVGSFPASEASISKQKDDPPTLAAGASYTATHEVVLKLGDAAVAGTWYLLILADDGDDLAEADEENNEVWSVPIEMTLPTFPDLTVTAITGPETVLSEAWFQLTYRVENIGLATAEADEGWEERVLLSNDSRIGSDILLTTITVPGPLPATEGTNGIERTISVRSPVEAGDYWLVVQTDAGEKVTELREGNNTMISTVPFTVTAAYAATVSTEIDTAQIGTPIPLAGEAHLAGSSGPAAHVLVNIHIGVRGFDRVISALTDDTGHFEAIWHPLPTEGGHYTLGACHPGQASAPVQDSFDLVGLTLGLPDNALTVVSGGDATVAELTLKNVGSAAVNNIAITISDVSANLVADVDPVNVSTLAGQATSPIHLTLSATDAVPAEGSLTLHVTSSEAETLDVLVPITVLTLHPELMSEPETIVGAMLAGAVRPVAFTVANVGATAAAHVEVQLPDDLPWLSLSTPAEFGPLEPGASAPVEILLAPDEDLPLGAYSGEITLVPDDGPPLAVPFTFRMVSSATGSLTVQTVDETYYFTAAQPSLSGCTVSLVDAAFGDPVAEGTTDADGLVTFASLPEGYYQLKATAPQHAEYHAVVFVSAAEPNDHLAFLSRETVTYVWTVTPTEIEDVTDITIETLFETNVPAPVVTLDPAVVDLIDLVNVGDTKVVNVTIENHGWIAAEEATFTFDSHPYYRIEPLVSNLGTLPARSSLTVPVRLTRIAVPEGEKGGRGAPCGLSGGVSYIYVCGPYGVSKLAIMHANHVDGDGCSGGFAGGVALGGSAGPGTILMPATTETSACDACPGKRLDAALMCIPGFIPGVGCAVGTAQCIGSLIDNGPTASEGLNCVYTAVGCVFDLGPIGIGFDLLRCFCSIKHACGGMPGHPLGEDPICDLSNFHWPDNWSLWKAGIVDGKTDTLTTYDQALADLEVRTMRYLSSLDWLLEILGDSRWLRPDSVDELTSFLGRFHDAIDPASAAGGRISDDEREGLVTGLLPVGVDAGMAEQVCDRWNTTMDRWEAGIFFSTDEKAEDFVALDRLQDRLDTYEEALAKTREEGFDSIEDAIQSAQADVLYALTGDDETGGTCARVRLRINQQAVLTRDAFEASFEISNRTETPIEGLGVDIHILDRTGNVVSDVFAIHDPELSHLDAIDGSGTVGALDTGTAHWILVPTTDAAPEDPTVYYVGGDLHYVEAGTEMTVPLTPVAITVYPQPELDVTYFHQRDVLGDDPWTDDVIEPSVPFELAVMVHNRGGGGARDLHLDSAQPEIVDNEKGLLINFRIIAHEVAGENLLPTLTADFGTVDPGEIKIARWWLTASMQGQFVEYEANFQHRDIWGDDRLSIIKNVDIHELIHTVRAPGEEDDGLPDFLVNDVNDTLDLPDMLYLSDGSTAPVSQATDVLVHGGPVQSGGTEITLTATIDAGWTYLRTPDPGGADYRLVRVVRHDGGRGETEIPADNFWQTDRTFIGLGLRPRPENILHLLDKGGSGEYTLYYEPRDQVGPRVSRLSSPGPDPLAEPVSYLEVTFSEAIDPASFTREDVTLSRNDGPDLISEVVAIHLLDETTFRIEGLETLTGDGGVYTLTLRLDGIEDRFGNAGEGSEVAEWTTLGDAPVVVSIDGLEAPRRNIPLDHLTITFSEAIDPESVGPDDFTLQQDGGPDLIDDSLIITDQGEGRFLVEGLAAWTETEGNYEFKVDAAGVRDPGGMSGVGNRSVTWTMDTTPPTVRTFTLSPTPGSSPDPVSDIVVTFSEDIDPGSFTRASLELACEGGANLLDDTVTIEPLSASTFRVSGLADVTAVEGAYTFRVAMNTVRDMANNAGTGVSQAEWKLDRTAPDPATNLRVSPDTGMLDSDGLTSASHLLLQGDLAEPSLLVDVHDETTGQSFRSTVVTGTSFSCTVDLQGQGTHHIRVRARDAAGNGADAFFDVFIDQTPPMITGFTDLTTPCSGPLTQLDVTFSEALEAATLNADDLTLTLGGTPLDTGGVTVSALSPASFRLAGLPAPPEPEGEYRLTLALNGVKDLAGNPGEQGLGPDTVCWTVDQTPPEILGLADDTDPRQRKTWTWHAQDTDDVIFYRYVVDQDENAVPEGDYLPVSTASLADEDGLWYIHVQARDRAGNESPVTTVSVLLDNTPPTPPAVSGETPTNEPTPTWTWTSTADDGSGEFRYRLDNPDLESEAPETTALTWTPETALSDGTHTLYVQEQDAAGNWSPAGSFESTIDATSPTVVTVSSPDPDGRYGGGETILIHVTFSEPVFVSGIPELTLETGVTDAVAIYAGGSGDTTLVFSYAIAAGQSSTALEIAGTDALSSAGGTIRDAAGNDADLTLPAPGSPASLSAGHTFEIDPLHRFVYTAGAEEVLAQHGIWHVTGEYHAPFGPDEIDLLLNHDPKGKITGTGTYRITTNRKALVAVPGTAKGSLKAGKGVTVARLGFKGATSDKSAKASLKAALVLNPISRRLQGPARAKTQTEQEKNAPDDTLDLQLPSPMDGTWKLMFELDRGEKAITGTALLVLSDGTEHHFLVKGKAAGDRASLKLSGDPADPPAKAIKIKVILGMLKDGWGPLESFSGKAYGQKLAW